LALRSGSEQVVVHMALRLTLKSLQLDSFGKCQV
jgi:hypothetical protein